VEFAIVVAILAAVVAIVVAAKAGGLVKSRTWGASVTWTKDLRSGATTVTTSDVSSKNDRKSDDDVIGDWGDSGVGDSGGGDGGGGGGD
jgi:uncharacterized membrane protein YgcG